MEWLHCLKFMDYWGIIGSYLGKNHHTNPSKNAVVNWPIAFKMDGDLIKSTAKDCPCKRAAL